VNAALAETETVQCFSCRNPLTIEEQENDQQTCPYCAVQANQG
jgi:uncharacterized CHY-type Zn-finger protein